ncbi:hypothetical protein N7G274_007888 [Stereocaulon virgatum]|uniref:Uncharacterized protein n=1 Tax=Stereocaulon virgatum TaxID=373712 RepID=A0ABR4A1B8_9LECA
MNAFLMGYGHLEIEERRPRSWNEPKIKRLAFAKNRRHVLDDRDGNRNRIRNRSRRDADDWALVPQSSQQRRANQSNQVQEWDRQRFDAKLRFDQEDERHQNQVYQNQLQFMEEQYRRRFFQGEQLRNFIMQGQQFPRHPLGQFPQQGIQHHGQGMQPPGPPQRQIPIPPQHGGGDNRIQNLGPLQGRGGPQGGQQHDRSDDDSDEESDESEVGHRRGRGRPGRGRNDNRFQRDGHPRRRHGNGNGGHNGDRGRSRGRSDDSDSDEEITVIESESESDDDRRRRPQHAIEGGHDQRLPRVFYPRSRSRGSRHHSRRPGRRRPSRIRVRSTFSDDSDSDDSYGTHVRFARRPSRSRASMRRARSASRNHRFVDDSDDSFEGLNRRPWLGRLRSKSRGARTTRYYTR